MLGTNDLVSSDNCYFAATGVTSGDMVAGVRYRSTGAVTSSLVMRSSSGTVRYLDSYHRQAKVDDYTPEA